ncbi:non-specific lipid transfer protein GPI-anchored 25 [Lycium barbarum]|uniref:non-specific lipid transfer protein GPI-anchored 25 n=1 Tax=Lycium barbarum TaxID=112863 RepID=UPI00293F0B69|nr:non-specific lipid transfer protein GPI-anchored 25 [Lycium barbarum]
MADLHVLLFMSLLLLLTAGTLQAQPEQLPSSSSTGCADELVAFSPCLPYISESPNNISDTPPIQCCDNFAKAFDDNTAICLCYLVHNPQILGFPINIPKLLSLTSVCPVKEKQGQEKFSLDSLCSGPTMLPPFRTVTDHRDSSSGPRSPSPGPSPSRKRRPTPPRNPPPEKLNYHFIAGHRDHPSPPSDVDVDNPFPAAQASPPCTCSSAIGMMCNYRLWVFSAMSIFLLLSCKHAT